MCVSGYGVIGTLATGGATNSGKRVSQQVKQRCASRISTVATAAAARERKNQVR